MFSILFNSNNYILIKMNVSRSLIMIVYGPAACYEGSGQNPDPERVIEFVNYMKNFNVEPLIFLIDPAFKNPYPIDIERFEKYPSNVIVVADTIQNFYRFNPNLKKFKTPIAYIMPYSLSPVLGPVPHNDNPDNPNRLYYTEPAQKQFDPFEIIKMGNYDPITNTFNRNIYDFKDGGKLPLKLYGDPPQEVINLTPNDILKELNCLEASLYSNYLCPDKSLIEKLLLLQLFIRDNEFNGIKPIQSETIENIVIALIKLFKPYLSSRLVFPRYNSQSHIISMKSYR